jgi:hypothetical protein
MTSFAAVVALPHAIEGRMAAPMKTSVEQVSQLRFASLSRCSAPPKRERGFPRGLPLGLPEQGACRPLHSRLITGPDAQHCAYAARHSLGAQLSAHPEVLEAEGSQRRLP